MLKRDYLSNKDLKLLAKKSNTIAAFHFLIRMLMHLLLVYYANNFFERGQYAIAIFLSVPHWISYSFLGWAGIGHELFHKTVFTSKRLNDFLFKLFSILTWNNYAFFEYSHWKHHKDTLHDDDLEGTPLAGIAKIDLFLLFTFDYKSFFRRSRMLLLNSIGVVPSTLSKTPLAQGKTQSNKLIKSSRITLLIHLLFISLFIFIQAPFLILLITFAPFFITFFNRILAVSQHYATFLDDSENVFNSSRTVLIDPFFSFLYANMNYHIEHHLFPYVPYYNLPALHDRLSAHHNSRSLISGWVSLVKFLRKEQCFR